MSSASYHKHMGGEAWWRDWIEPVFIGVSPQPQASQGTLRNATGMFKGKESGGSRWKLICDQPTTPRMEIHLAVNNHLPLHCCSMRSSTKEYVSRSRSRNNCSKAQHSWEHANPVVWSLFHLILVSLLTIHLSYRSSFEGRGGLDAIPTVNGRQVAGPSQGWHIETNTTFTSMGGLELPVALFLIVGGSCGVQLETTHTLGEHSNANRERLRPVCGCKIFLLCEPMNNSERIRNSI